jgi:hypothetical protein
MLLSKFNETVNEFMDYMLRHELAKDVETYEDVARSMRIPNVKHTQNGQEIDQRGNRQV